MAKLPDLTGAETLVALNATVDGRLVAVSASGNRSNKLPGLRIRVHLHETGDGWRATTLTGMTKVPNKVELLPDGNFLLVQSGSVRRPFEPVPDNAHVFNAAGQALRSFRIGGGIGHHIATCYALKPCPSRRARSAGRGPYLSTGTWWSSSVGTTGRTSSPSAGCAREPSSNTARPPSPR
jgi:hypothetical protein